MAPTQYGAIFLNGFSQMNRISALLLVMPVCILLTIGCNSPTPEASKNQMTLPVKGKVLLKGQPILNGTISFEPDNGGREANGNIENGTFSLTTFQKDDGAVAGLHRVAVKGAGGGKKDPVPLKYHNYSSSGLTVEVSADKAEYVIELK
jgi:hypothetical protein